MSEITLAQAQAQLTVWLDANTALASGKEYRMPNGKSVKREDGPNILAQIEFWDAKINRLKAGGGIRIRGGTPVG